MTLPKWIPSSFELCFLEQANAQSVKRHIHDAAGRLAEPANVPPEEENLKYVTGQKM